MGLQRFERILRATGWHLEKIAGSHRHYRNRSGRLVVVATHGRIRPDVWRWAWQDMRHAEQGGHLWKR